MFIFTDIYKGQIEQPMNLRYKTLTVYIAKCVAGILVCFFVTRLLTEWVDYTWCLISVVLVLSPEGKDALDLALTRIKANLVGAATGVLILLSSIPSPYNIAVGAIVSLFVCDQLKLNSGARSTLAAVIIILLFEEGRTHVWDSALSRVIAVVLGCLLGLIITYVFRSLIKINEPVVNSEAENKKEREA
jgi:uncharacterized membrane protein YgaE (UPF0421/DUF939 family)